MQVQYFILNLYRNERIYQSFNASGIRIFLTRSLELCLVIDTLVDYFLLNDLRFCLHIQYSRAFLNVLYVWRLADGYGIIFPSMLKVVVHTTL